MTRHRSDSLSDLVEAARTPCQPGHEDAFDEIVRRFRGNALASAFRLVHDAHLAQDVTQEAFLDAYQGLDLLREPAAFPGWFRRIVFKHADRIRRRRPLHLFEELESAEGQADDGMTPEAWAAAHENVARVRHAISTLPEHERAVTVLFYFGNASHAEIGERLSLPVSTVKKRLHDARQRLRTPLEAGGPVAASHAVRAPDVPVLRGEDALRLASLETANARDMLARFEPDEVAAAVQELPARDQVAFLEVSERLPEIVPCLPELTLTQTIRSVGMDDAGWLVEFASPEQRVAALDLDCWRDQRISPTRVFEWIDALIEAGTETLLAAFDELDPELWILALQWMAEFSIPGHGAGGPEPDPWNDEDEIVANGASDDGVVFYCLTSPDHEERVHEILSTARIYVPSLYWDFVYGATLESPRSCEEVAARWHSGRLNDLGFPDLHRAMSVYQPLSPESVPVVSSLSAPPAEATPVPANLSGTSLGWAISQLPAERAAEVQSQLFALANAIAVADRLPLAEADTLTNSLGKALEGVDRGLEALATAHHKSLGEVADTTATRDLFRVGASLNPELRPRTTLAELEEKEDEAVGFDWDVVDEWIAEVDQTLADDGSLRR